jgi:hypothetical protein
VTFVLGMACMGFFFFLAQVREFESLEHPLFEITLNMRTYSGQPS